MADQPRSMEEISNLATQLLGSSLAVEMILRRLSGALASDPTVLAELKKQLELESERIEAAGLGSVTEEFRSAVNRIIRGGG